MSEPSTILKIERKLGELTKGLNKEEKKKFLKDKGYSWFEVVALSENDQKDFLEFLNKKPEKKIIIIEDSSTGYTVCKPENPKSVKDISFSIEGMDE